MLETAKNTDYQNCLVSLLTVIAQKPELSMSFWGVFFTVEIVNRFVISKHWPKTPWQSAMSAPCLELSKSQTRDI
jgi:hypothetical protein